MRVSLHPGIISGSRSRWASILAWAAVALLVTAGTYLWRHRPLAELTGAVLRQEAAPGKQLPVAGAEVSLDDGLSRGSAKSDATGLFRLKLRPGIRTGQIATLRLQHPDYRPVAISEFLQDRLYIIRLVPTARQGDTHGGTPQVVSDIRIRYSVTSTTTEDIGSAVKTFEVTNQGDVPCDRPSPCSPDGKWKAAIGGASLDAGEGSEFHDARVTCIAGPCPFTKVESDSFSAGGRTIAVSIRNWSDTASFVLEAEVTRTVMADNIRQSFPVMLDRVLSFTLPALAQGLSIEATINGTDVVYPVSPSLRLSWANCAVTIGKAKTRLYRCELKPGFEFALPPGATAPPG